MMNTGRFIFKNIQNIFKPTFLNVIDQKFSFHTSSVASALKYPDWKMIRDVKRRKMVGEYAFERINLYCLRKNSIIPQEIKDIASETLASQPKDASITRVRKRCVLTSRPRGVVNRWRLSRIAWRLQVDYNKVSGIQRAMW